MSYTNHTLLSALSYLSGDLLSKTSVSFENRRRQATAIVMLGVIGAEFGQEIEPSRNRKTEDAKKTKGSKSQEGFNMANYSLARQTSEYKIGIW